MERPRSGPMRDRRTSYRAEALAAGAHDIVTECEPMLRTVPQPPEPYRSGSRTTVKVPSGVDTHATR